MGDFRVQEKATAQHQIVNASLQFKIKFLSSTCYLEFYFQKKHQICHLKEYLINFLKHGKN